MPKRRILVIEDDEQVRTAIRTALQKAGYDVDESPYLASSIGASLTGDYDVITLDLGMPGIDGTQVARMLQLSSVVTPVLVISGLLEKATRTHLQELGVQHFLPKPSHIGDLLEAVERAVSAGAG